MSDPTRKIKNPLLTAAGQGFPFEEYSPESLLVPPAEIIPEHVPEITRDVGEFKVPIVELIQQLSQWVGLLELYFICLFHYYLFRE